MATTLVILRSVSRAHSRLKKTKKTKKNKPHTYIHCQGASMQVQKIAVRWAGLGVLSTYLKKSCADFLIKIQTLLLNVQTLKLKS